LVVQNVPHCISDLFTPLLLPDMMCWKTIKVFSVPMALANYGLICRHGRSLR
jgi:hypothetical protein